MDALVFLDGPNGNVLPYVKGETNVQRTQIVFRPRQWVVFNPHSALGTQVGLQVSEGKYLLLAPMGDYWTLPESHSDPKLIERVASTSGRLTAVLLDQNVNKVQNAPVTHLDIAPANLTSQEMEDLIRHIGVLAISTSNALTRSMYLGVGERQGSSDYGHQWHSSYGHLIVAESLLTLSQALQENWDQITKAPLYDTGQAYGSSSANRILTDPNTIIQRAIFPYRSSFQTRLPTQTVDCIENRFLKYVVRYYLVDYAKCLVTLLENPGLQPLSANSWIVLDTQTALQMETAKGLRDRHVKKCKVVAKSLSDATKIAETTLQSELLSEIPLTDSLPEVTSRLLETPGYEHVCSATLSLTGDTADALSKVTRIFNFASDHYLHPDWNTYEIWILCQVYEALVRCFRGMTVPVGQLTPFEVMNTENGNLNIKENTEFVVEKELNPSQNIRFRLFYTPDCLTKSGRLRRPDLVLIVEINSKPVAQFIFDMKYRGYSDSRGGDKRFIEDVIGTAMLNYFTQVKSVSGQTYCETSAAYILHSDKKIDYWGELPLRNSSVRETLKLAPVYTDIKVGDHKVTDVIVDNYRQVGHRYGAISLFPRNGLSRQLRKLFNLLFHYHIKQLDSTCLTCGSIANVHEYSGGILGTMYVCDVCKSYWVIGVCRNGHRVVKQGEDTIHSVIPKENPTMKGLLVVCPTCNDGLPRN